MIQVGTETLRRALIYGNAEQPVVWAALGEAYLLADDRDNAQAAFTIAALFYRAAGLDERSPLTSVLQGGWLREREEIMMAWAWATLHRWNHEFVSEELIAKATAPWPKQPPPKKPRHRPAQQ